MIGLEERVAAMMRLQGEPARVVAAAVRDPERELRQILLELGAPDHLSGHPYTVRAVLWVLEEPKLMQSVSTGLYKRLAEHFHTTPDRIERSIRHLAEVTWLRGDQAAIRVYFGSTVSPARGKPTNRELIARLANVVRQRMWDRSGNVHRDESALKQ